MLGELKFNFRNKHLVYMHDTNARQLFEEASRPFSHGCMRVRNPRRMAEILLGEDKGWDAARVADLIANGPPNNEVPVEHKIGVHITYFTAWVDERAAADGARRVRPRAAPEAGAGRRVGADRRRAEPPRAGAGAGERLLRRRPFKSVGDFISSALGGF